MSKYPGKIITDLAPAGYSVFFDGTGDYLTVADNTALEFGSSDFTIEAWFYFSATPNSTNAIVQKGGTGTSNLEYFLNVRPSSNTIEFSFSTNGTTLTTRTSSSVTIAQNTWYHVAVARTSATLYFFLNGISAGTAALSSTLYAGNADLGIGASGTGANIFAGGYISNLRVLKGTALYTAAFTPPTQLLNITNTSLLTCNSPAIVDQSTNAFAITVNGNAAVSTVTPFTAYVPYNPALGASTPGVWTLDEALQARATRQWNMYDPYFNSTTLLLHGNGTNAAQNNTFLDSSSNNFTITRNGNTTQGSFSPFSQTGWSNYFSGSSPNDLTTPDSTAFEFTGDFTIEAFVYPTALGTYNAVLAHWQPGTAAGCSLIVSVNSSKRLVFAYGIGGTVASDVVGSSTTVELNTWSHILVSRNSGTIRLFVNGTQDATTRTGATGTLNNSPNPIYIGSNTGADYFTGYISNLRVLGGTGVTSVTVPTAPLTDIANTILLTCQSNRFIDTNTQVAAKTITVNGSGVSVQPFSPFYPVTAYTPATIGGSGYFDGTGDYLASSSTTAFNSFCTGSATGVTFTVEALVYPTATVAGANAWQSAPIFAKGATYFNFGIYNNKLRFYWYDGAAKFADSTATVPLNAWSQVSATVNGSSITLYVNGASSGTGTFTGIQTAGQGGAENFGYQPSPVNTSNFYGYISSVRISNNVRSISAQTTPFTSDANTIYLLNFTNAGIIDSTAKNVLETVGNAQISTTQSKFGGSSMYFDGTGDGLFIPYSASIDLKASYTIEAWVYPTTISGWRPIFNIQAANAGAYGTLSFVQNGSALLIEIRPTTGGSITSVSGGTLTANTWQHVTVAVASGSARLFVNGTQVGSTTSVPDYSFTPIGAAVGANANGYNLSTESFNGYIDDLRITKGIARYTAAFTPQTSQWQDE